jgi:hypothetical protein
MIWFEHRGVGSSAGDPVEGIRGDRFDDDLIAVLVAADRGAVVVVAATSHGARGIGASLSPSGLSAATDPPGATTFQPRRRRSPCQASLVPGHGIEFPHQCDVDADLGDELVG